MKHGSLFSGIGGFDLAAEWMGWENIFHCEWMEFPRKVLDYHFPNADSHIDICKTDFKKYANKIDILTGGFPCQPFSMAGKRKGTEDERYLWGEMLRAIQEIKPKYVIAENVFGITNIDGGLVFEQVCLDLEAEGYEVQPFIIPAAAKNAPHRRDRVWFVAYSKSDGSDRTSKKTSRAIRRQNGKQTEQFAKCSQIWNATNTNGNGLNQCNSNNEINPSQGGEYAQRYIEQSDVNGNATNTTSNGLNDKSTEKNNIIWENNKQTGTQRKRTAQGFSNERNATDSSIRRMERYWRRGENRQFQTNEFNENNSKRQSRMDWEKFPTESPICGGDDGLSTKLDGITFSKWRAESIKGYGNAIVPQVAYEIFKALEKL